MVKAAYDIENIITTYRKKIYHLALSLSRNTADADDITQNTFIKVIEHIDRFRGTSKLSTWLYRIAVNEALQLRRKRRNEARHVLTHDADEIAEANGDRETIQGTQRFSLPSDNAIEHELTARIQRVIDALALPYRTALVLKDIENLPLDECVRIAGVNVHSFKARLHRARKKIKETLLQYDKNKKMPAAPRVACDSCDIYMGFVYSFVAGKLKRADLRRFEKSLDACGVCKKFFRHYTKALAVTNVLRCHDIPPALMKVIRETIPHRVR